MLMRYAGIPARVVTGYQGGSLAPDGKSWEVRQMDAHAWTEVWVSQQWQRIDPTAIIAPQRIDNGMQNLMSENSAVLGEGRTWTTQQYQFMTKLRVWSDYASYQWQSKVVGYNADSQRSWMSKLGLNSAYAAVWILIIGISSLIASYFLWIYIQKRRQNSPFELAIEQLNRSLLIQMRKQPAETFKQWMLRISASLSSDQVTSFYEAIQIYERNQFSAYKPDQKDIHKFRYLLKNCACALKNKGKNLS
jgi:hypothetical protein